MKFIPHSVAIHLASNVLPVPGGPKNNIPFLGRKYWSKICLFLDGNSIVFITSSLASASPPTSSHYTLWNLSSILAAYYYLLLIKLSYIIVETY